MRGVDGGGGVVEAGGPHVVLEERRGGGVTWLRKVVFETTLASKKEVGLDRGVTFLMRGGGGKE
jgi:hypothetical protein